MADYSRSAEQIRILGEELDSLDLNIKRTEAELDSKLSENTEIDYIKPDSVLGIEKGKEVGVLQEKIAELVKRREHVLGQINILGYEYKRSSERLENFESETIN